MSLVYTAKERMKIDDADDSSDEEQCLQTIYNKVFHLIPKSTDTVVAFSASQTNSSSSSSDDDSSDSDISYNSGSEN